MDNSDSARDAAEWAGDVAAAWGAPVDLVHASAAAAGAEPCWLGQLRVAVWRTGADPHSAQVVVGRTVDVLAEHAARARLLVLGSYGEGARSGVLAGTVAHDLLERVTCPVAVVRGKAPEVSPRLGGPVLVGVDGSAAGHAALLFAADLAHALGSPLAVVRAWSDVVAAADGSAHRLATVVPLLAAEVARAVESELEAVRMAYPGLRIESEVVQDAPVRALIGRATEARLLVVGHRGHQQSSGMLLGSTSRALVEFAPCTVVVTRPFATEPAGAPTTGSREVAAV